LVKEEAETLDPEIDVPTNLDQWTSFRQDLLKRVRMVLGRFPERA
jgi:hypothetical protein